MIEHEADSGAAMLGDRARWHGIELDVRIPTVKNLPATAEGYDAVLSLGASPGVNDPDVAWWLDAHLDLLRDADRRGVAVFGVCFGAQALSVALGGRVERAVAPEVGWYTVTSSDPNLIESGPWLQWHVDCVVVPPTGASVLAVSPVCVQAYTVGPHLAVQFHPEVTIAEVTSWSKGDPGGPPAAGTSAEEILARFAEESDGARARANRLMDRFLLRAGVIGPDEG